MIVDLIAERPRLNTEATMYSESYDSEIQLMKTKATLYLEFTAMQKDIEREENKQVHRNEEAYLTTWQACQELLNPKVSIYATDR